MPAATLHLNRFQFAFYPVLILLSRHFPGTVQGCRLSAQKPRDRGTRRDQQTQHRNTPAIAFCRFGQDISGDSLPFR